MYKNFKTALVLSLALLPAASAASVQGADGVTVNVTNPKRVVALNGTTVELIYRLGKQNTVVGTDVTGTYPANKIPSVGHWAQLPAEGIISLKPDLVIGTADNFATPKNATLVQQLRGAGVKVLVLPATDTGGLDGVKTRLNLLSQVYGVPSAANALTRSFDTTLAAVKANRPKVAPRVIFLYAHSPSDASIYGTEGGANELIELAGGRNVAPFKDVKPLTPEALVAMNPDAIIMLDRGLASVGGLEGALKMPGVAQTNAGKNKRIYTVDNSIRWIGPRLPEFALKLAREWKKDFAR
ncbi:hemin ABC transporter substrate-binding protein [Deinococcus metallilatus]|uniref:Hemin ABC transporter substrate-binding protein n=1 Tax=Deinococcus metallilatus TaxID=1211322 RepID=A0AAJ5F4E3_9DEIO|nr:ABC transporter substrate-binding protein [Deinococcus metallilatus]MBB5294612.1 iron complex transport system substrate-binding protein [Deinococcus metallilatus]QBY07651.1 hemin ABC transporter substrate-binding protein [Deinococcus metallilatus]RXJ14067.1 hemin ABC transporter substrate-binding protein [Deinococcus metallilatus]TLK30032.1 hemin ABC transporter substrate-binding protein [Deinococcus metallilatus]GMA15825.1 hemin ABC transporter substrate-binding protein [Deinococcus metal